MTTNQGLALGSWFGRDQPSVEFAGNTTTKLTLTLPSDTQATLRLEYSDYFTGAAVVKTFRLALPKAQDRVCVALVNYVMETMAVDADMRAEITIINNSAKRVYLRLLGNRSLTERAEKPTSMAGQVTVKGRSSTVLASKGTGILWRNEENVVVLPEEQEWGAFTSQ